MKRIFLKNLVVFSCILVLSVGTVLGQNTTENSAPAGNWIASCDSPKLKIDEGYEICLITIDTGAYDPGFFSSEFYFGVDYIKDGERLNFECSESEQVWEDWGINLYFSFSYSGSYSKNELLFDAGEGYSVQNSYQLKPEFIEIKAKYELIDSNQLKIVFKGTEYLFYRMNE